MANTLFLKIYKEVVYTLNKEFRETCSARHSRQQSPLTTVINAVATVVRSQMSKLNGRTNREGTRERRAKCEPKSEKKIQLATLKQNKINGTCEREARARRKTGPVTTAKSGTHEREEKLTLWLQRSRTDVA
jgi:hypothetical protein